MTESSGAPRLSAAHLSLAAVGLMWTLPFLQPYHRVPLPSFYSEWLAIALGLLALAWMARPAFWRAAALPAALLPLLGFIVLLLVQHVAGKVAYGGQVLVAALYIAWAGLLVVLARELRLTIGLEGVATVLAWFLVVGGVVGAVLALLQHYQISDLPQSLIFPGRRSQVYGNVAQNNHFAAYSTLALASLAYLCAARRLHVVAVAAGALPLLFVIGLSGSRSSLLFLAFALGLALLYAWRGGAGGRRLSITMVVFIGAFAAMLWLPAVVGSGPPGGGAETALQRLGGGEGSTGARSLDFRLQIARESWAMFAHAPWLGVGWGQFPWNDFEYRALHASGIATWPFNHAHNIVLQLMAETGIAGVLLIAGAALLWLRGLRHAAIDLPHWWLATLITVIALHSLVEHPLWYAYFLGMAAIALGLLATGDFRVAQLERAGAPLMAALIAGGALYAVLVLENYRHFERVFARGGVAPGTGEFAAIVGRAHREPVLAPYAELAIVTAMSLDRERVREKLAISGRVMRFAPISSVAYRHAILLALAGEGAAAERQLAWAARVYPGDLPAMMKSLEEAAARHPSELAPLIKSAAAAPHAAPARR